MLNQGSAISQSQKLSVTLDLYYAPDPSSQIACSIGGNIAENSGGVHCLKYGLTVHNVLSVTIALDDGSIVTVGSDVTLDSPGYDLLALTIGSEGLLAVVLEITVRLLPKPEEMRVVMAAFDDVTKAGDSVGNIIAAELSPARLEMMDGPAVAAVEDFMAGYPLDAEALLLCEVDGTKAEVADELARVEAILKESGATMLRIASNEEEHFCSGKVAKVRSQLSVGFHRDYYCMDGTIPRNISRLY